MPEKLRSPLALIYFAVFISIVSFSMVFPLLPLYAQEYDASETAIGFIAASFALGQLLFAPFWGKLSDRFGRKPIISVGLIGMTGCLALFAIAPNLLILFLSRFLQGVFSVAILPAARAYVADITTQKERVRAMGHIGAFIALGVILGPAIGGFLARDGISTPFLLGAFIAFLNFLFVLRFLPESYLERKTSTLRLNIGKLALQDIKALYTGLRSPVAPLFILAFLWSFSFSNNQVALPLLGFDQFQLDTVGIGLLFTALGIVAATTQFFFLSRIADFFGQHKAIIAGLALLGLSFAAAPFMPNVPLLYIAISFAALGSATARPINTALISEETKEEQGITMGTATAFESLGRLIGPLLGGALFGIAPAAPFLFSGVVVMIVLTLILTRTHFLKPGHAL